MRKIEVGSKTWLERLDQQWLFLHPVTREFALAALERETLRQDFYQSCIGRPQIQYELFYSFHPELTLEMPKCASA